MLPQISLLTLGAAAMPAVAETILGVTVYSRHGDRSTKHYGAQALTNLGYHQNFQVGSDYRSRYIASSSSHQILGISENKHVSSQIYSTAPDQGILLGTATAFLQGLYPPLGELDPSISVEKTNDGESWTRPLNGYQYITLHGEDEDSPDTIWIKGDEGCPAVTNAAATFKDSSEYKTLVEETKPFYAKFWDVLKSVYDYEPEDLSYANAFDIFDLINVAKIHNSSSLAEKVSDEDLFQLRTLADSAEFNVVYNKSQPARSIGGQTLAGVIRHQLNQTIASKGALKFSLFGGSYDNFQAFFGITDLPDADADFFGLPDYASTMAFELFTDKDTEEFPADEADINVRFLFRNGSTTDSSLSAFPLFGRKDTTMSWSDFSAEIAKRAISSVEEWCQACSTTDSFCAQYSVSSESSSSESAGGLSNAVAGVIGAMVTLGVVALCVLAFWLFRKRANKSPVPSIETPPLKSMSSVSSKS
ncbi:hypothetical protein AJ80_02120 [Polytolypa hystricis UAMH7299]|uniref:Acid phosphatase n=1 Tax=Polytolypa hystricis (strain UAMH7299) TaxID=1447883 RepID=A0A2B7YS43_POLH7|nr:hypothetical protein AJ80_02120 [Polytolypa hystricis UAMH7299]